MYNVVHKIFRYFLRRLCMQGRGDEDNHTMSWFTQYFKLIFREGARE